MVLLTNWIGFRYKEPAQSQLPDMSLGQHVHYKFIPTETEDCQKQKQKKKTAARQTQQPRWKNFQKHRCFSLLYKHLRLNSDKSCHWHSSSAVVNSTPSALCIWCQASFRLAQQKGGATEAPVSGSSGFQLRCQDSSNCSPEKAPQRHTTILTHPNKDNLETPINLTVIFDLWEEAGVPREMHVENMQTPFRKILCLELNPGPFYCTATVQQTAAIC